MTNRRVASFVALALAWFGGLEPLRAAESASAGERKKKIEIRKVQEVNFDAMDVDGQVRNPDGAYLVQKRGIEFIPLYKVRKSFDDAIKESVEHVK
jgi:hypothetical protein